MHCVWVNDNQRCTLHSSRLLRQSACSFSPLCFSLKVEYDKLANEKTEMQRHYVMVRARCASFISVYSTTSHHNITTLQICMLYQPFFTRLIVYGEIAVIRGVCVCIVKME